METIDLAVALFGEFGNIYNGGDLKGFHHRLYALADATGKDRHGSVTEIMTQYDLLVK